MAKMKEQFALTNPISIITGKEPKDFTREDLIKVILEKQIERITFHYTGIDGKIKELKIPVANRRQAEMVLTEGERVDGSSLFKGIVDPGRSDLYVIPLYKSAFLNPFDNKSIDFMCRFLDSSGNLAVFTPDNILSRAVALLKQNHGVELHALGELEFFLIGNHDNTTYPLPKQKGYHASAPFVKGTEILNTMLRYITQITGTVKYAHNEVGLLEKVTSDFQEINGKMAEQTEIEFLPAPIDEAADNLVLSRWIIRNVSYRNNFVATFVPKLEIGHAGNGMHVHMALMKSGKNLMQDKKGALTQKAKTVIGGLCHYAQSLTAFGNTVSAAYLRLVPHQEAPTKVCWSEMNRSALIRVPLGWGALSNLTTIINPQQKEKLDGEIGRQTVELRSPDGSCNTHLLLAGITLAADWGLTNEQRALELAKRSYVAVNIHDSETVQDLPELATSCAESAQILNQQRRLFERENIFPPVVIDYMATMLSNENDKDLSQRLRALPDDEKLQECRRIMHRDIHKH